MSARFDGISAAPLATERVSAMNYGSAYQTGAEYGTSSSPGEMSIQGASPHYSSGNYYPENRGPTTSSTTAPYPPVRGPQGSAARYAQYPESGNTYSEYAPNVQQSRQPRSRYNGRP